MHERIAIQADVHFGKPCVAGTRIPVQTVLELVRDGVAFADIVRDFYPDLTRILERCGQTTLLHSLIVVQPGYLGR